MNIQHLRYIVEVARVGSITGAAANLFMGQPNLSKAIREVEAEIGIVIFSRSARGVVPTDKGLEFLEYAKNILVQMEKIEQIRQPAAKEIATLSLSIPRASYISYAFAKYVNSISSDINLDINLHETSTIDAINNVNCGISNIAVIRCDSEYDSYFMPLLKEKPLRTFSLLKSEYRLLISSDDELAKKDVISINDLYDHTEIVHGDRRIPYLSDKYGEKQYKVSTRGQISIYERGNQLDLIRKLKNSFMWVSAIPEEVFKSN